MTMLPAKDRLLAACRGEIRDNHPLLRWACELSEIHHRLLAAAESTHGDIDQHRATLIHAIDSWVAQQVPSPSGGARLHTETLGAVINRLAEFNALAFAALANPCDSEPFIAWERLAELAVGYEDLIDEVSSGRRRLPCAS
ncbi:DUF4254 domain-containing protein [Nocardia uniformis]|uniref:DUF4254 domain-containing protein n=1 Tax=Nocardia uniformis TaxID=53432 RepID=A0A849CCG5_9NOCA|nr:DUF4254 domain-containing protein [Nocardia uniformis]NNH73747.1 DUF4254 domain-containing protein [Nocardia uniformis]